MPRPASAQLLLPRRLFDAVYEMNVARNHADFVSAVVAGLGRLIASDLFIFHILERKSQRLIVRMMPANPHTPDEIAYYTAHPDSSPLNRYYQRTGETVARRMSDVIDRATWLASEHYRVCMSRLGFKHVLGLPLVVDADTVGGISYNRRGPDFTRADCALLDAFAPHFHLAWRRHPDPWRVSPRKKQPAGGRALTARESDVLYWITEGKQNREIAMILGITLHTVQKHVAHILTKLDAENRHALTVLTLNRTTGR